MKYNVHKFLKKKLKFTYTYIIMMHILIYINTEIIDTNPFMKEEV